MYYRTRDDRSTDWVVMAAALVTLAGAAIVALDGGRNELKRLIQRIEKAIRQSERRADFDQLIHLHNESRKIADQNHHLLNDARETLDDLYGAIEEARLEIDQLKESKQQAQSRRDRRRYERQVREHEALRQKLFPKWEELEAKREQFLTEVRRFNSHTRDLKETIRDRCGKRGQDWYQDLTDRTKARKCPRVEGVVKWYDSGRGYGFIQRTAGGQDVYVNYRRLIGIDQLSGGDRVEFYVVKGDKGPWALDVRKI